MDSKYYFNGALRCPKTNPFMDSQNYLARVRTVRKSHSFYGLQKLPSTMSKNLPKSFLKQSEKLPLYGLRKLLFYIAQKPL